MPDFLRWEVWRLVFEGVATLEEINRSWDLNDLMDAHIALDLREKAQRQAEAQARRGAGRGR